MRRSSLASLCFRVFSLAAIVGCVATGARAQTLTTFTFESNTFTGLGSHAVDYTENGLTLQISTQTSAINTETIPGVDAGATAIHFGNPLPENAAYFNLSTASSFDLVSLAIFNESGADMTLTVGTSRGTEVVQIPYNAMNPNAAALFWTAFTSDPTIFQDIGYFNVTNDTTGATYAVDNVRITTTAVPEPAAWAAIAGFGVLGLVALRRRRMRA